MNRCPYCGTMKQQVKSGRNPSGSQRYLCKKCQRVYTPEPSPTGYPDSIKSEALNMYQQGFSLRAISRRLEVWPQSVANWVSEAEEKRPFLAHPATKVED